jgi:hypothetical protein
MQTLRLTGIPAAPGLAAGPVFRLRSRQRGTRCIGTADEERSAHGCDRTRAACARGAVRTLD